MRYYVVAASSQLCNISSFKALTTSSSPLYQSRCGLHLSHLWHWVSSHTLWQAGQRPPVSKVFQLWPQLHRQRELLCGSDSHLGQRICMLSMIGNLIIILNHVLGLIIVPHCPIPNYLHPLRW